MEGRAQDLLHQRATPCTLSVCHEIHWPLLGMTGRTGETRKTDTSPENRILTSNVKCNLPLLSTRFFQPERVCTLPAAHTPSALDRFSVRQQTAAATAVKWLRSRLFARSSFQNTGEAFAISTRLYPISHDTRNSTWYCQGKRYYADWAQQE